MWDFPECVIVIVIVIVNVLMLMSAFVWCCERVFCVICRRKFGIVFECARHCFRLFSQCFFNFWSVFVSVLFVCGGRFRVLTFC